MQQRHSPRLAIWWAILLSTATCVLALPPVAPPPAPPIIQFSAPAPTPQFQPPYAKKTAFRNLVPFGGGSPVSTWREHADDDTQVIVTLGSARPVVQSDVFTEGSGAFHLANPGFTNESIVLDTTILPNASTKLFFESQLGYSTVNQFARVQVSTNDGATWATLWSQAGTGGAGEGNFKLVAIPLSTYAGTDILIRLFYEFTGGSAYTAVDTVPPVGWFIDDIQIGENFTPRPYLGTGDPSADEVQILEFINRARADAAAEAARLSATTDTDVLAMVAYFHVDFDIMTSQFATLTQKTQPLSMNAKLLASARLHSLDMLDNVFQGHFSSANPPPPNQPGDSPGDRIAHQGYSFSSFTENIFSFAKSPWFAHAGFNIDWGYGTGGMQDPPGHRIALHNPDFREIGIGAIWGSNSQGTNSVGPLIVTQDLGTGPGGGHPFITGVTYDDANTNNFYDSGEGIGGVRVDVDGSNFYAISSTHGTYSVPVITNGTYAVTFHRAGFTPVTTSVTISNSLNAKTDYRGEWVRIDSMERPAPNAVRLVVAHGLPTDSLGLSISGDLVHWTNIPSTKSTLYDGRSQLDVTLTNTPAKAFFKANASWSAPD